MEYTLEVRRIGVLRLPGLDTVVLLLFSCLLRAIQYADTIYRAG